MCVFLGYFGEDGVVVVAKKFEGRRVLFEIHPPPRGDTATEVSLV